MTDSSAHVRSSDDTFANMALASAAGAVVLYVVFLALEIDNALWLLVPVEGLTAVFLGWRAGGGSMPTGRALIAVIVGLVATVVVLGWLVVDLAG